MQQVLSRSHLTKLLSYLFLSCNMSIWRGKSSASLGKWEYCEWKQWNNLSHVTGKESFVSTSLSPQNLCSLKSLPRKNFQGMLEEVEEEARRGCLFVFTYSCHYVTCQCYLHYSNPSAKAANLHLVHSGQMLAKDVITAYVALETPMKGPSFL